MQGAVNQPLLGKGMKNDVVFVSPFNAQSIELKKEGFDAVTINKFFAKGIGDMSLGVAYDWSDKK